MTHVRAKDLREGDEVRVTVMGGEDYLTVVAVTDPIDSKVRVQFKWGWHVPIADSFWDELPADERLTVCR